jgi:hypothetical protein
VGLEAEVLLPAVWCGYNQSMFARKVRVEYEENGQRLPCPLKWLDSFSMRSFTNFSVFDDTLPVADGEMEIGSGVPLNELSSSIEEWFKKKGYLPKDSHLSVKEK